jgi:hypothetical protein
VPDVHAASREAGRARGKTVRLTINGYAARGRPGFIIARLPGGYNNELAPGRRGRRRGADMRKRMGYNQLDLPLGLFSLGGGFVFFQEVSNAASLQAVPGIS